MDTEIKELVAKIAAMRKKIASDRAARNKRILRLRAQGKTLQEIGDEYGLTRERVRQVIEKARRAA